MVHCFHELQVHVLFSSVLYLHIFVRVSLFRFNITIISFFQLFKWLCTPRSKVGWVGIRQRFNVYLVISKTAVLAILRIYHFLSESIPFCRYGG